MEDDFESLATYFGFKCPYKETVLKHTRSHSFALIFLISFVMPLYNAQTQKAGTKIHG